MNTSYVTGTIDLRRAPKRSRALSVGLTVLAAAVIAACSAGPAEQGSYSSQAIVSPNDSSDFWVISASPPYAAAPTPVTVPVEQNDDNFDFGVVPWDGFVPNTNGAYFTVTNSTLPAGVTIDWQAPTVPTGAPSNEYGFLVPFTVRATAGAAPGSYPVTITGKYTGPVGGVGGGMDTSETTTITIVVTPAPVTPDAGTHCITEAQACANTCGGIKSNDCGGTYDCPTLTGAACCFHERGRWYSTPAPGHCLLQ